MSACRLLVYHEIDWLGAASEMSYMKLLLVVNAYVGLNPRETHE